MPYHGARIWVVPGRMPGTTKGRAVMLGLCPERRARMSRRRGVADPCQEGSGGAGAYDVRLTRLRTPVDSTGVREGKVLRIRRELAEGRYDLAVRLDVVVGRILDALAS